MEMIIVPKEHFEYLMKGMEVFMAYFEGRHVMVEPRPEPFIDNSDFMRLMKISRRTAQNWRDKGLIDFFQIGHKIYYRLEDVEVMMRRGKKKSNITSSFSNR